MATPSSTTLTMDEGKMKQATDILMKKRLPHGPGSYSEQRLEADPPSETPKKSTSERSAVLTTSRTRWKGVFSDSDAEMTMEAGEKAPLQRGSSDPHVLKADRVTPDEFPETEAGIEDFRYAIYMETNEAASIDLRKIGLLNRIR